MFRKSLIVLALVAAGSPVLAFDLPYLTFPETPATATPATTTSTSNTK